MGMIANDDNRYEQLTIRAAALREELHTEIERVLNDVIKFKIHIQKSLEEYEAFVDEEVSREYENLAAGENSPEPEEGGVEGGDDAGLGADMDHDVDGE
jgi:kinetochore protein NDC80